jgi:hypothetical protein
MAAIKFRQEALLATGLGAVFFFFYSHFGLRLAQGIYFDYLNLAFDFDPAYFIHDLVGEWSSSVNYKHPLVMLFRPFANLFALLGFAPKEAAVLVMALFGGLTVALVYAFCRAAAFGLPEALLAAVFYGAGSTPLFTSFITESYGWASFSIVLVWLGFLFAKKMPPALFSYRLVAAVLVAGVTITNIMQAMVAEFFVWMRTVGLRRAVLQTTLFALATGLAMVLLLAILQPHGLWDVITRPVQTAKEVYWLRTKGDTVGLVQLLLTFLGYSYFAPDFTQVAISPVVWMKDFREFSYTRPEAMLVYLWGLFAGVGVLAGLKHANYRQVAVPLLLVMVMNVLFHLDYQFRGSIYIYAAHLHFPIFALGLGAAPWISEQSWRIRVAFLLVLVALTAGALFINSQRAAWFVTQFDALQYPADDPSIAVGPPKKAFPLGQ